MTSFAQAKPIAPPRAPSHNPPTYNAQDLVGEDGKAWLRLDDQTYLLRITRAGKLILTK